MQKLIDPDTALNLVLSHTPRAKPSSVTTMNAIGLALAEAAAADADYPPFPRAMMDGYAVRMADAGGAPEVIGEVAAGGQWDGELEDGFALSIMTGAPCPAGTEAVVPKENVEVAEDRVQLPKEIRGGQHIAPTGSECPKGRAVLDAGDVVTPFNIAALMTFGLTAVSVYAPPRVAVITTGNELVPADQQPGPSQIRNSNGPMIAALLRAIGVREVTPSHATDERYAFESAIEQAADADFVVLTGAVSAGKYDTVPQAVVNVGGEIMFHKVMQKPGKPILFACSETQTFFGLPGNPLACHLGFHRYIAPAVWKWCGLDAAQRTGRGELTESIKVKGPRTVFMLARVEDDAVTPLAGTGSADIYSTTRANAMLRFDPETGEVPSGSQIDYEWLAWT